MATSERRSWRTRWLDIVAIGLAVAGVVSLAFARLAAASTPLVRESGWLPAAPSSVQPWSTGSDHGSLSALPPKHVNHMVAGPSARPVRLSIPAIDVQTTLIRLGLESDDTLQVPSDASVAGWYALGPRPGDPGASVIVGHVDSRYGSAIFYRLGELAPGRVVHVGLASGIDVRFRVYAVRELAKAAFPTSLVYGPTRAPELRLVTCGGPFDAQTGHYLDNVVVFARYAGRTTMPP